MLIDIYGSLYIKEQQQIDDLFIQGLLLQVVQDLRDAYNSGKTRPLEWRIGQIKQIKRMIIETSSDIIAALAVDLHKVC